MSVDAYAPSSQTLTFLDPELDGWVLPFLYQCCGSGFIESGYESGSCISSESGSGSRVLMTKNWRKESWKIFYPFFISNYNLLFHIPYLHKGRPSSRRSLQLSKENIQHDKKLNLFTFSIFVGHFCPPGSESGRIANPDPDTDSGTPLNPDKIWSGIHKTSLHPRISLPSSVLGSNPASPDTVELEGRQMHQCPIQFIYWRTKLFFTRHFLVFFLSRTIRIQRRMRWFDSLSELTDRFRKVYGNKDLILPLKPWDF